MVRDSRRSPTRSRDPDADDQRREPRGNHAAEHRRHTPVPTLTNGRRRRTTMATMVKERGPSAVEARRQTLDDYHAAKSAYEDLKATRQAAERDRDGGD